MHCYVFQWRCSFQIESLFPHQMEWTGLSPKWNHKTMVFEQAETVGSTPLGPVGGMPRCWLSRRRRLRPHRQQAGWRQPRAASAAGERATGENARITVQSPRSTITLLTLKPQPDFVLHSIRWPYFPSVPAPLPYSPISHHHTATASNLPISLSRTCTTGPDGGLKVDAPTAYTCNFASTASLT